MDAAFKLLGGIGLFLLGMVLLTDGLKAYAGNSLRGALMRFTGTPLKAFGSGAMVTLLIQSSSATTVSVIGFVSAGLLTFPQAIGVVMGASLGTTGTGWIIAVLGLKISVGFYALPLVGVGALFKLLASGRWRSLGLAIAGFGLIFIGIETLQHALRGLSGVFNLAAMPAHGLIAHLVAMTIGIVLTVLLQSSSAAVATTLTALHAGAIHFEQAASLVIGAAIGTTITGVLAAIGGSVPARRTAAAHVLFNLATGLIAVVMLPLFLWAINWAQQHLGLDRGAMSLAAFHSAFIGLGVLLFLPAAVPLARLIERWLPDCGPALTRHFDDSLLRAPSIALETSRRALVEITASALTGLRTGIGSEPPTAVSGALIGELQAALADTRRFFSAIPPVAEDEPLSKLRTGQLHAMDHLARLLEGAGAQPAPALPVDCRALADARALSCELLKQALVGLADPQPAADWLATVQHLSADLAALRRTERPRILDQTASGAFLPAQSLEMLDFIRWLDSTGYHAWRLCFHLSPLAASRQPDQMPATD
jgi:phosphate:Na+ symporter